MGCRIEASDEGVLDGGAGKELRDEPIQGAELGPMGLKKSWKPPKPHADL